MPSEKLFTPRQATLAVLNKVEELLKNSELVKYETSNSKKLGYKLPEAGKKEIYPQSEDKKFNGQAHIDHQKAPGNNPKEKAEGNNPSRDALPKDLGKSENPDKEADAKLGEKVEHDVERHMIENKDAEQKEGHKIMKDEKKNYPKDLASKNIEAHMKHKEEHPGGAKQAEAIGIEQARHGEHEMDKHGLSPSEIKGHLKLAKFMGRMEFKKSLKKNDGMI
jgi:hypothetical protein